MRGKFSAKIFRIALFILFLTQAPTKKKATGGAVGGAGTTSESSEDESDDPDRKKKGVEGLIEIEVCIFTIWYTRFSKLSLNKWTKHYQG